MPIFSPVDWIAIAVFAAGWAFYSWLMDQSPWRDRTLTAAMNRQRLRWMEVMLRRELRIVDTSIMAGLQNGTAFFASASLLAIGAAFTLLSATERVVTIMADLPGSLTVTPEEWEVKALGLLAIYAYAFFKFGWSYRLFNYSSILVGATPPAAEAESESARRAAVRAAEMNIQAARHFNLGLRAFFFSVGFLGWFANGWVFLAVTSLVVVVLVRRQFVSPALAALAPEE